MNNAPVMVLVRPQLGENIGKAARAMANFGLAEMRLVAPRDGWPNPSAGPAAAGADFILDKAQVFETTAQAVADCAHVFATTVRKRGVTKPVLTPAECAAHGGQCQRGDDDWDAKLGISEADCGAPACRVAQGLTGKRKRRGRRRPPC